MRAFFILKILANFYLIFDFKKPNPKQISCVKEITIIKKVTFIFFYLLLLMISITDWRFLFNVSFVTSGLE